MRLLDDARAQQDELVELRRRLHSQPEVGLDLPRTRDAVLEALEGLPLEVTTGRSLSSVTAVLRGPARGPAVLLRGDMDALPVQEDTGLPFAARNGAMHACGHDLHITMLVGAARLLSARRAELAGDVVFMFQPGEEGYDGAAHMLAEGLLDVSGSRPLAAYALHVASAMLPSGVFASRPGPILAAAARLAVSVRGAGGHGAQPHRARDPVQAACAMVTALQVLVTRSFDIFDPVLITVGVMRAGTAHNVIPETASFEATLRSFSPQAQAKLSAEVVRVCEAIATAHGVAAEVVVDDLYPPTVNHADAVELATGVAVGTFGAQRYVPLPNPMAGSEDFSRVLDEIGGAMIFLGATPPGADVASAPFNHSPQAVFDEAVLADGAALLAELAAARLDAS